MKSTPFEITLSGTHTLKIPHEIAIPFIDKGHKRVEVVAFFEEREIKFHAALQNRNGEYLMIFGKRKQTELGVFPNDYFLLQLFEDKTKYGVEVPEEFEAVIYSDPEAYAIFENFTVGKKRGIIYMVKGFRNSQTRIDKTLLICENLKRGVRKNPDLIKSI